jgi:phage gp29-like protein
LSSWKPSTTPFHDFLAWCDRSISRIALGHAGGAEGTPGGLDSDQAAREVRQDLLESDAKALATTLKFQLPEPWKTFTFGP